MPAESEPRTPRPTALERVREFAILADQILGNPVVVDGWRRELKFQADPDGPAGREHGRSQDQTSTSCVRGSLTSGRNGTPSRAAPTWGVHSHTRP
jgi:hypothetical protein